MKRYFGTFCGIPVYEDPSLPEGTIRWESQPKGLQTRNLFVEVRDLEDRMQDLERRLAELERH